MFYFLNYKDCYLNINATNWEDAEVRNLLINEVFVIGHSVVNKFEDKN